MNHVLERILEGRFEGGMGSLEFSCADIALILAPGALYEGTFTVYGNGDGETCGYVTSTDQRMECVTDEFHGMEDIIGYRFHGEHLRNGDVVKGEFHIVSNRGEYRLPYEVLMDREPIVSSVGEIRNLFQFAGLAKENWGEALRIFYSQPFGELIEELDEGERQAGEAEPEKKAGGPHLKELYRGFSANMGNPHNMEEFLIAAGQKSRIEYLVPENELVVENPVGVSEEAVGIVKNGWGYTRLEVSAEGDFLYSEKEVLSDDDFLGNRCRLPVYIDSSRLHGGRNFGRITIRSPFQTLTVAVTVRIGSKSSAAVSAGRERMHSLVRLMELYQSYRLGQISPHTWMKESGSIAERLAAINEKDVMARLMQAQLLIARERFHEANWMLEHCLELMEESQEDNSACYAYYLYLTTLLKPEGWYLKQVAEELEDLYRRNQDSWQVAWVLLFLSPEYNRKSSARWGFLEKQFENGCTSPLIYLEAMLLLNQDPALLRALKPFEIQVLSYGSRQDMLSWQVKDQMLYLAGRMKDFSPVLLRVLVACYERRSAPAILQEICSQLIKGGITGPRAFKWYELGVEQELRLTKLFEYYMMSVDLEGSVELSRKALLYFSYQVNLDLEHTAFLYRYVVDRRQQDPELYESYRERIEFFVLDQIKKEHISRDLAYLYRSVLVPELFGELMAEGLMKLLFAWEIRIEEPALCQIICRAVCCRPDVETMMEYPVVNGGAWVPLYRPDDAVLLEDTKGNRYLARERCPQRIGEEAGVFCMTKLMDESQFLELTCFYGLTGGVDSRLRLGAPARTGEAYGFSAPDLSVILFAGYIWEQADGGRLTDDQLYCGRLLVGSPQMAPSYREKVQLKLLREYALKEDARTLDMLLDQTDPRNLDDAGRCEVLGYLVRQNRLETAYQWVADYGTGSLDGKTLLQILSYETEHVDYLEDEVLLQRAAFAFRQGKYDGNILRYLAKHFRGLTSEMTAVWRAAGSFGVDTFELSENLLLQILFTGSDIEEKKDIFHNYIAQGAKAAVEEAYLRQSAYDYLIRGIVPDETVVREMLQMFLRGEEMHLMEKLTVLCLFGSPADEKLSEGEEGSDEAPDREAGRKPDGRYDPGRVSRETLIDILGSMLREMMDQGIYLNAFRGLMADEKLLEPMQDKTVVEYRTQHEGRVLLNYRIRQPEAEPDIYKWEELAPVCRGLYCKSFILFFGESLEYYVEQEVNGVMERMAEGVIEKEDTPSREAPDRYDRINDILLANAVEDYDSLDRLLEDYYHREYLVGRLFVRR